MVQDGLKKQGVVCRHTAEFLTHISYLHSFCKGNRTAAASTTSSTSGDASSFASNIVLSRNFPYCKYRCALETHCSTDKLKCASSILVIENEYCAFYAGLLALYQC